MKKYTYLIFLLSAICLLSCSSDDENKDIEGDIFMVNGIQKFPSVLGNYVGANFADNASLDGCLYTYACYYEKDVAAPFTEISLYFYPIDFSTIEKGDEMKIDINNHNCRIETNYIGSRDYYGEFEKGSVIFESYDLSSGLLKIRFNNFTFTNTNNSPQKMVLDGIAVFEYR